MRRRGNSIAWGGGGACHVGSAYVVQICSETARAISEHCKTAGEVGRRWAVLDDNPISLQLCNVLLRAVLVRN